MRCPFEDQCDLGDPAAQSFSSAQVERYPRPPAGIDLQRDRSEGLGSRVLRETLLVEQPHHALTALPTGGVLAPASGFVQRLSELRRREHLNLLGLQLR